MENKIENFAELEASLNKMAAVSEEMAANLKETATLYEEQKNGWYSATSMGQSEKMVETAENATTIPKNINTISEAVQKFKTKVKTADETK